MPWTRAILLFVPQMLGGIVAAALVSAMFPGPLIVDTSLGNGTSIVQGLFIEMFLTALLMITILMLAVEKSKTTFLAPMGIGLALFVAHLTGKLPPTLQDSSNPFRCALYGRLPQSYSFLRSTSRHTLFPRLPLDLLARTCARRNDRCRLLSLYQASRLRRGESLSRCGT